MKNWKFIQVGNAKDKNGKDVNVGDLVRCKTDDPSLSLGKVKSVSGETIKVDMTGDDDIWTTPERLVEKVGNKKVVNKYEWTTRNGELQYFDYSVPFGGHKKGSVEKTSGGYTGYKMNGSIIISKKEFQTEEEAKKYVENKKARNESIEKQTWSMFKGLTKDAEKEVGNEVTDLKVGDEVEVFGKKGKVTKVIGNVVEVFFDNSGTTNPDRSDRYYKNEVHKVGNAYTPNPELIKILEAFLHNRMSEQEARVKIMKITGDKNITDMMIHSPGGFIPAGNKKIGNAGEGWYTFVGPKQSKPKYKVGDEVKTNKGKGKILKVQPMRLSPTPTYLIELDNGSKEWRYEEEIGNKKVGNTAHSDKVEVIKRLLAGGWSVEDIYSQLKTEGYDVEKGFIEKLKTGNETLAEYAKSKPRVINDEKSDKFGYVMREFKEGKLKSGSGETVTNPEQAKAIAYSESEKVDNLSRARNSIKTKNADITLWNGNDSAYIKEDGHVQYLENNSFVVDEDKYDSQEQAVEELTKKGYRKK